MPNDHRKCMCEGRKFLQDRLIDRTVRVTISDDRVVVGKLICIDNYGNLIVENSTIHNTDGHQSISNVMVPGKHIVKLEIS